MKIKASVTSNIKLDSLAQRAPIIVQNIGSIATKAIADGIAEEILRRIPVVGGWYNIYRKSIEVKETSNGWAVCGLCDIPLAEYPWDVSLLNVVGSDPISVAVANYNPWPIDMIPPVSGGYSATATVESRTAEEVSARRGYLSNIIGNIRKEISALGASLAPDSEIAAFKNGSFPDLRFLANRLEKGYPGFPRIAHLEPSVAKAYENGSKWAADSCKDKLKDLIQ